MGPAGETRAQEYGAIRRRRNVVHILIIVAAAVMGEVLLGLLVGSFLHHCSELADPPELKAMLFSHESSAPTAPGVQGIPQRGQS